MPQQILNCHRPLERHQIELAVVFDADLLAGKFRNVFGDGVGEQEMTLFEQLMMPMETIGLVIEKMRKRVSCAIGVAAAGFCRPSASNQPIWPRRATMMITPGMVPLSISRLNASDIRCNRMEESPSDFGFGCGSGGVRGAAMDLGRFAGSWSLPLLLLLGGCRSASLAQNIGIEQGVTGTRFGLQSGRRLCLKRRG